MNSEKEIPIPKHENDDSLKTPYEIQDSCTTTMAGGNSWTPVTPEKVISEKWNAKTDNWEDLIGMYTGLLQEETNDKGNQNWMKMKMNNGTYFTTNDPANWKCNHLASIVERNNGIHLSNRQVILQVERLRSTQSQRFTVNCIPKDVLSSPLNSEPDAAAATDSPTCAENLSDKQKTPTKRKKHRPRVITPKKVTPPGETRVKRKYVKKKGINISETQPIDVKTPNTSVGKRKYVRKKGVQNLGAQLPAFKSCKRQLNFEQDETRDITKHGVNLNFSPQETRINKAHVGIKNIVFQPSINLAEKRGIKRQSSAMDSLFMYQKLLLGVAHRAHDRNLFLENHKKIKIEPEFQRQMNRSFVNPANLIHFQYQPHTTRYGVTAYPHSKGIVGGRGRVERGEFSVDYLTYKLKCLRIYDGNKKGENELVVYRGSNVIVPYEPIKKRNQRPKVNLDPETDRLWRLLMEKDGSEGGETLDKDKEKWWEHERQVFRGRADSFIARMHLVQGDRRFSRWKGSVVDSVIGVFLTQNVSDHLSSSAFMSLAAKFPIKTCCQDGTCEEPIKVEEPKDILKCQETYLVSSKSSEKTVDEIKSSSESNLEAEDVTAGFETGKQLTELEKSKSDSKKVEEQNASRETEDATAGSETIKQVTEFEKSKNDSQKQDHITDEAKSEEQNASHETEDATAGSETIKQVTEFEKSKNDSQKQDHTVAEAKSEEQNASHEQPGANTSKERKRAAEDERNRAMNWDSLRKKSLSNGENREQSKDAKDSIDYEALRHAPVNEISDAIKERGMNNLLADRMKDFLNRVVRDHGKIDLEWLRDAPPEKAKDYLLSFRGLGLKSVECIRLLTLHHLAFPVDTNVGRIAVRLGWVPLQPLPESLQLHLLEMYPVLDSIQKYLWPRLCKLDQLTLYELHYQMITFGKVFCTKSKPNCNACPMRAECRHFASAFASARLALPGPEEKRIVTSDAPVAKNPIRPMPLPQAENDLNKNAESSVKNCEPIIEEPTTPEPEATELSLSDIEDQYYEDSDEIPSIKLNMEEFTNNLHNIMQDSKELQKDMSKALVALNPNSASIPTPKLKDVSRLRTEHQVYELPDSHRLLEGLEKRELDDPSPYLLAIWTPGETANSVQPPEKECSAQESGGLCDRTTCFSCNNIKEANSQVVRGTILIPCRTAMRGSFPLNGTYFQVNEMFADHASSLNPIDVPRAWIWNLPRRTVYFGTSVSTIFRGLSTQGIQYCFWKGFVCVRGFDRKTRAPRPLMARLHFPPSKLIKTKSEGK